MDNKIPQGAITMAQAPRVGIMPSGPLPTPEEIHAFRKEIDATIQKSQTLQNTFNGWEAGAREISLVVTKLQEGKMWAGKILEAMGESFPKELADKAE